MFLKRFSNSSLSKRFIRHQNWTAICW